MPFYAPPTRTTGSSGIGVNKNDLGYDIWLCAGQSNMSGYGSALDTYNFDAFDPRVFQFPTTGAYKSTIIAANEPMQSANPGPGGHIGPSLAFARYYVNTIPGNRRVLLVPTAFDGTALLGNGNTWLPGNPGQTLYEQAIAQANLAIIAANAQYPNSRFIGTIWLQGEQDANGSVAQALYASTLDTLIAGFRARITGASSSLFLVQQMVPDYIAANSVRYLPINAAHIDTPRRNILTAFGYGAFGHNLGDQGSIHFDASGQRLNGLSFASQVAYAQANVLLTPALPPPSVSCVAISATSISVAWTRPVCRFTNFVVQYQSAGASTFTTLTASSAIDSSGKTDAIGSGLAITGLTAGLAYNVQVSTVNEQGTSLPTLVTVAPVTASPPVVASVATNSVSLTWAAPPSGYTASVLYSVAGSGSTLLDQLAFSSGLANSTTSSTVTGLVAGTAYNFALAYSNGFLTSTSTLTVGTTSGTAVDSFASAYTHVAASNVTITTGKVTSATDLSGNSRPFISGTNATYQPTVGTVGGLTAVLATSSTGLYATPPTGSFTKILLVYASSLAGPSNFFSHWNGGAVDGNDVIYANSGTKMLVSTINTNASDLVSTDNIPVSQWFVLSQTYDSVSGRIALYFNGKLQGAATAQRAITTPYVFLISQASPVPPAGNPFQYGLGAGGWAEAAIFNSVLSELQVQQCSSQLASKYAITLG